MNKKTNNLNPQIKSNTFFKRNKKRIIHYSCLFLLSGANVDSFSIVALALGGAELLPVALEAEHVVLERVALLALHAGVQQQATVLRK
jgi:hypothetical protein